MNKTLLSIFLMAVIFAFSANAVASDGRLRLHVETKLADVTTYKEEVEGSDDYKVTTIGIGPATGYAIGYIPDPRFSLGIGYAVLNNLIIGTRLGFGIGTVKEEDEDDEDILISYGLLPYVEYVFLTSKVRPFITGTMGIEGLVNNYESSDGDSTGSQKTFLFTFGGGGGVSIFPTDRFSVDFTGLITYALGKSKSESEYHDSQYPEYNETYSSEDDISRFQFAVKMGISGWF